jgi:hypothetical protein
VGDPCAELDPVEGADVDVEDVDAGVDDAEGGGGWRGAKLIQLGSILPGPHQVHLDLIISGIPSKQ